MMSVFDHEPLSDGEVHLVAAATTDELLEACDQAREHGLPWRGYHWVIVAYLAYGRLALRLREEVGLREPWEQA